MNGEKKLQWMQLIKLIAVVSCAMLYAYGGIEGKWLRRFLAPAIAGATIFSFSRDWKILIKMPLLMLSSSLGYGADETIIKVFKRFYVGAAMGISTGIYETIFKKQWYYMFLTTIMCVSAYIILGVLNPFSARVEETMLGLTIYSLAIMPGEKRRK